MLDRVKLTCFQQHRDLEVRLGPGLTAIRGANEAGKSTLLRGVCYALFGAKAMPDTLEALVTWGEDAKKLKSEVDFTVEGVTYHVKRSKSGAEVNYDGGRVTGQNEVTNFVCRLLRVDAGAAPRLMLSNQNEIRGALEAGPKETTALIERLSDFNQIDELIDLMQQELTLGNVGPLEAAIDAAYKQLQEAEAAAVAPDLTQLSIQVQDAVEIFAYRAECLKQGQAAADAAGEALAAGKVAQAERQAVLDIIDAAGVRMEEIDKELEELAKVKATDNVEAEIQRRRTAIESELDRVAQQEKKDRIAEIDVDLVRFRAVAKPEGDGELLRAQLANHERDAGLRKKFAQLFGFTGPRAEGDSTFRGAAEDLEQSITATRTERDEIQRLAAKNRADAELAKQQMTQGACGFCGQDFSNVPEVVAKNAGLQANVDALLAAAWDREETAAQLDDELKGLQRIREASQPALKVLGVVGADYAALADGLLPPVLKWIGPAYSDEVVDPAAMRQKIEEIEATQRAHDRAQAKIESLVAERGRLAEGLPATLPAPADVRALRREIRELESQRDAYTAARAKLEALQAEHNRLDGQINDAEIALDDHPAVDIQALQQAADAARAKLEPAQTAVQEAQNFLNVARRAKEEAIAAYERAKAAEKVAKAALGDRQKELADLRFNNKLLKDVRAARPIISDKLWNMVLGAVSRYFSEMRGVESVVTKGQDGFMVDGHLVSPATLSGSALDILGLAIRVALVKTFLPACPFFVLDEPAQGCDDNRTANLLSFLSACGFGQVLLVTHEDTSESVAQNMITIGG